MDKKLQVFVSSTYTDLIEERQAAVEAILDAGHIPAGMELFKAGNESQLQTIYKWIDESDVYMLILGGRYGSIEYKSGKSYVQLEYEYAMSKEIPIFAVILSDSFLAQKINTLGLANVTEKAEPNKYKKFKSLVMSKIIKTVNDCKDIKIAIYTTLNEFINKYDLTGWTKYNIINNSTQILKENAFIMQRYSLLISKNDKLKQKIHWLEVQLDLIANNKYGNYYFSEIIKIFKHKNFPQIKYNIIVDSVNALILFIRMHKDFCNGVLEPPYALTRIPYNLEKYYLYQECLYYCNFALLKKTNIDGRHIYKITDLGNEFYNLLKTIYT